ncbi:probable galacturonosyltransferase 9 [Ananas comosus]|uniref:Hexosyltransferase n=1 Tax=Ananas comosus TaxID=4615 RepID=A0A6P5EPW9_ANACO|nr:probable galacturonosyltransferase 9 [Ananas comosus]
MAGGRPFRPAHGARVLVSAALTLLLFLAISSLLSSSSSSSSSSSAAEVAVHRRSFLAAEPDPLRARFELIRRQASDHAAVVAAYAAHARRLKLDAARQLAVFEHLSSSLSSISLRLSSAGAGADAEADADADDDPLRPLEKEAKDRVKLARQLVAESKESFDTQLKIQKLRDTVFAVHEQLRRARRLRDLSARIAAGSTPKSLHCLAMRLMADRIARPESYPAPAPLDLDSDLLHYALFSDNVVAASVVVASAVRSAAEPRRHVFHVVTDPMYLPAMQAWFTRRPPARRARVEVRSAAEFAFLNASHSPVVRRIEAGRSDLGLLEHLRFYLLEMFPELRRIVLLEEDVVVQRDLAPLWTVDLDGKVNGAVETCFGGFRRYSRYLNFSHPAVRERLSPRACAWAYGVNVFDLDAWRRERCTDRFHRYFDLNEDGSLWSEGSVLPAGLMTFYGTTKPLDKSWHVMGLGYNPSISPEEIRNAAVIHFSGNMKPWLDVALNQYKHLWTKYVDTEMEFLPLCNFGL